MRCVFSWPSSSLFLYISFSLRMTFSRSREGHQKENIGNPALLRNDISILAEGKFVFHICNLARPYCVLMKYSAKLHCKHIFSYFKTGWIHCNFFIRYWSRTMKRQIASTIIVGDFGFLVQRENRYTPERSPSFWLIFYRDSRGQDEAVGEGKLAIKRLCSSLSPPYFLRRCIAIAGQAPINQQKLQQTEPSLIKLFVC